MSLVDLFYDVLAYLGFWQEEAKILFLGLDNSGKTTLLHMLKDERLVQHAPTQHPTSEELSIGRIKFKAFDLGGHQIARRVWKNYYAKESFAGFTLPVRQSDDALSGVPFVVLGNKIDIPEAAPEHEMSYYLGLARCTTGKGTVQLAGSGIRPIEVFMCSVVRKMDYGEGFRWMSEYTK